MIIPIHKIFKINFKIFLLVITLCVVGFVMLYSAGETYCGGFCTTQVGSWTPYLNTQIGKFAIGFIAMFVVTLVPITFWRIASYPIYIIALILLVFVFVVGEVGKLGEAQRWINIAGIIIQPAEFLRVALVLALAKYFSSDLFENRSTVWLVPSLLVIIPLIFILKQPDLGTAMLCSGLLVAFLFVSGLSSRFFVRTFAVLLVAVPFIWLFGLHQYQRDRILVFFNPAFDTSGVGYHIIQSEIAIGNGGLNGMGFLQGTQAHLQFLPEIHTDFIFSLILEEFGFIGGCIVIALFALLITILFKLSRQINNPFSALVIFGVAVNLFLSAFLNMGMALGFFPVVGKPLPFISFGGSSLIATMIAIGLVQSALLYRHKSM